VHEEIFYGKTSRVAKLKGERQIIEATLKVDHAKQGQQQQQP
jgi:hypothetical protein